MAGPTSIIVSGSASNIASGGECVWSKHAISVSDIASVDGDMASVDGLEAPSVGLTEPNG